MVKKGQSPWFLSAAPPMKQTDIKKKMVSWLELHRSWSLLTPAKGISVFSTQVNGLAQMKCNVILPLLILRPLLLLSTCNVWPYKSASLVHYWTNLLDNKSWSHTGTWSRVDVCWFRHSIGLASPSALQPSVLSKPKNGTIAISKPQEGPLLLWVYSSFKPIQHVWIPMIPPPL